ncbi:hypothetical protein BCR43DRAFT_494010 [Syncephalastrum racemosum]|uniref:Uncharacterized protein n=1 Tax=Syncephalastrum racemosum TaxID=13706 RepID=A0A1X2H7G1_SYNRA|nr:hypothetical protein BCR43DRAFT_494010 [Syncephalastrum racemosum]
MNHPVLHIYMVIGSPFSSFSSDPIPLFYIAMLAVVIAHTFRFLAFELMCNIDVFFFSHLVTSVILTCGVMCFPRICMASFGEMYFNG